MRTYMLDGVYRLKVKNDKDCIFCKHCTTILYDSHGPYMWFCELGRSECDPYKEDEETPRLPEEHTCEMFEDSESTELQQLDPVNGEFEFQEI